MLDPKPVGSAKRPRPSKILSKEKLFQSWNTSRDSTPRAGSPGIDTETAKSFASNLDANLDEIRKRLLDGSYGFSRLRPVFIRKPNSNKERVICIPTVRDRLVQRSIIRYLETSRRLPISHPSSYGFIKGKGTQKAVEAAVELRSVYDWCVKADIESFFDHIPRALLKERVISGLKNHSLTPLICDAISCEIKGSPDEHARAAASGIKGGLGIRQGMPLSPLLANFMLSKFDKSITAKRIPMIRYADDLLLFFSSEDEAKSGQKFVEEQLGQIDLKLSSKKTTLHGPQDSVAFLGLEIAFLGQYQKYVSRISRSQIRNIKDHLEDRYSFENLNRSSVTLNDTIIQLSRSIAAYLGVYQKAHDYPVLKIELQKTMSVIMSNIYSDIFGIDVFQNLSERKLRFLGIDLYSLPLPLYDFDY